jgi:hypothetical protein
MGTVEQWAEKEGISRQAAYRRIRDHNIPIINGKVNFAVAAKIWQASYNPMKQRAGAASAAAAAAEPQPDLFSAAETAEDEDAAGAGSQPFPGGLRGGNVRATLEKVQLYRENWRAKREHFLYQKEIGEVVPVVEVTNFYGDVFARMQEEFTAIGAELMDDLAREADPAACRRIVERRINKALTGLSEWKPE